MNKDLFKDKSYLNNSIPYIYGLCDYELLVKKSISIERFLDISKKYNIKLIQYRDKKNNINIQKNNIEYIKKNCSIPIIINDKLELLKYCDGIHLGQEDLRNISKNIFNNLDYTSVFKILRKKYPDKIVGLSTHNELEILDANEYDLDYIGLGSYRKTNTKNNVSIIKDNASYLAKISKHIVCLIGGVRLNDKVKNINYNVIGSNLLENN